MTKAAGFLTTSYLFTAAIVATGLYVSSLYSYLLFHTLVELFNVLTAFAIFALAWNTRKINDNNYLLFIGIASLFTGALDLGHTLAYKGMGVLPGHGANLPTQLWIAFRFLFSISFFLAAFFIERKPQIEKTFAIYSLILFGLLAMIFTGRFPDCFIEGAGLTRFKIVSEYIISLIFLASLVFLILKKRAFDPWVLRLMVLSLIFSIAAELSFTQYVSVYGFANMLGHLFLLASVALIYRAVIVTGLVEPSRLLFRNLKQSEEAIRASETKYRQLFDELDVRVRERTSDLVTANEELEREIRVRWLAEKELRATEERFRTSVENMLDGFAILSAIRNNSGKISDFRYLYINYAGCKLNKKTREEQIGQTLLELLPLHKDTELFNEYVRIVETGEPLAKSNTENAFANGCVPRRSYDLQAVKLNDGFAVVWRDVSERRESERRGALTNELLKLYTQKFSRKEYLDVAVDLIRNWSGCQHAGIRIADRDGNIPYESCVGYSPEFLAKEKMLSIKNDQCICIRVAAGEREPSESVEITPNGSVYSNETLQFIDSLTGEQRARYRAVCMQHGFKSIAVVPIRHRDVILGAIHIADERLGMVPLQNVEFVEQLAFIVGEALFRFGVEKDLFLQREELVKMNEQLRNLSAHVDAVREGERTSIAREIHDELGQVLTAIKMDVSWLSKRLSSEQGNLAEKAHETLQIIDRAIQSVKRISTELRPGVLDDIGLAAAIEWAAKDFEKRTGIQCSVSIHPEGLSVDRMRSTALFRILQESITNIMRHAHASHVAVSLEEKNRRFILTVKDNGKGIKKEDLSAADSYGLIGMRERVQFLGGDLAIVGEERRGTTVTVSLPIDSGRETQSRTGLTQ